MGRIPSFRLSGVLWRAPTPRTERRRRVRASSTSSNHARPNRINPTSRTKRRSLRRAKRLPRPRLLGLPPPPPPSLRNPPPRRWALRAPHWSTSPGRDGPRGRPIGSLLMAVLLVLSSVCPIGSLLLPLLLVPFSSLSCWFSTPASPIGSLLLPVLLVLYWWLFYWCSPLSVLLVRYSGLSYWFSSHACPIGSLLLPLPLVLFSCLFYWFSSPPSPIGSFLMPVLLVLLSVLLVLFSCLFKVMVKVVYAFCSVAKSLAKSVYFNTDKPNCDFINIQSRMRVIKRDLDRAVSTTGLCTFHQAPTKLNDCGDNRSLGKRLQWRHRQHTQTGVTIRPAPNTSDRPIYLYIFLAWFTDFLF